MGKHLYAWCMLQYWIEVQVNWSRWRWTGPGFNLRFVCCYTINDPLYVCYLVCTCMCVLSDMFSSTCIRWDGGMYLVELHDLPDMRSAQWTIKVVYAQMIAKCKHAPYNLLLTPVTLLNTGRGTSPLLHMVVIMQDRNLQFIHSRVLNFWWYPLKAYLPSIVKLLCRTGTTSPSGTCWNQADFFLCKGNNFSTSPMIIIMLRRQLPI